MNQAVKPMYAQGAAGAGVVRCAGQSVDADLAAAVIAPEAASPCPSCTVRAANFCGAILRETTDPATPGALPISQDHQVARARQNILFAGEQCDDVFMLCSGWAISFIQLSDGRRQILSVLLPGDLCSATSLYESTRQFSVQALTEVSYCRYRRADLKAKLAAEPDLLEALARQFIFEKREAEALLVDLGRRTAEQRIARLVLRLMDRLERRGVTCGAAFAFPLRQQHIADIAGLTPVHVNRTLGAFRRDGVMEISSGILKLISPGELRRIAEAR